MKNITVQEYINLSEDKKLLYDSLLNSIKAKGEINLDGLTYNTVKSINRKLKSNIQSFDDVCYIFELAYKISKGEFYSIPIVNYFEKKNYLINFFVNLLKKEAKLLQSFDSDLALWQTAGGDRLNEFGDVLPLSQLAKIYNCYPMDLGLKPYAEIIYLLRMNNVQSQVENKYQELKTKQK